MPTQQQKINYIYDREKKKEFDECVMKCCGTKLSTFTDKVLKDLLNVGPGALIIQEAIKKCKIKVYGK